MTHLAVSVRGARNSRNGTSRHVSSFDGISGIAGFVVRTGTRLGQSPIQSSQRSTIEPDTGRTGESHGPQALRTAWVSGISVESGTLNTTQLGPERNVATGGSGE